MSTTTGVVTGVILAGGQGSRMGGLDKGLLSFQGRPLVEHILDGLAPQVGKVLISANRHLDDYRRYRCVVVSDLLAGFQGPLAGIAAALRVSSTPYILTVPCDAPRVPPQLAQRLLAALQNEGLELSVAHDGVRLQPVYALMPLCLLESLEAFLHDGGRKLSLWYAQHRMASVDFSDCAETFRNINTPEQQAALA